LKILVLFFFLNEIKVSGVFEVHLLNPPGATLEGRFVFNKILNGKFLLRIDERS